jgi:hypothetical protein
VAETPGRLQEKLDLMPSEVRDSTCRVVGSPREVIDTLRPLIGAGVQYFIFVATDLDSARLLAERVIPEVEQTREATPSLPEELDAPVRCFPGGQKMLLRACPD